MGQHLSPLTDGSTGIGQASPLQQDYDNDSINSWLEKEIQHCKFHKFPHLKTETVVLDDGLDLLVPGDLGDGA